MSTVNVTVSTANVTASSTNANITVAQTNSVITVSNVATLADANVVRNLISATDTGGDGSLSYSNTTGVFTYTGPSQAEVVAHFSNVSPVQLESNGQISVDSSALFTGKTTDDLSEGSTNIYFSTSGATVNSDALPQGSTNLYFTDLNANAAITSFLGGPAEVNNDGIDITYTSSGGSPIRAFFGLDDTVVRTTGSQVVYDKIMSNVTANSHIFAQNNIAFGAEWVDGSGGAGDPNGSLLLSQANDVADTVFRRNFIALGGGLGVSDTANAHLKNQYANIRIGSKREVQVYLDPYYVQGDTRKFIVGERTSSGNTALKPLFTADTANSNVTIDGNVTATTFFGDGSGITNLTSPYTDANVITLLGSYTNDISTSGNITMSDNTKNLKTNNIGPVADSGNLLIGSDAGNSLRAGNLTLVSQDFIEFKMNDEGTFIDRYRVEANGNITVDLKTRPVSGGDSRFTIQGDTSDTTVFKNDGTMVTDGNITTSSNLSAVHGSFTGATSLTATGNVSIGGNLDVTGNINSETVVDLFVEDRNITLQYGSTGTPSANSQIFVDRGSSANTYILWDEGDDKFKFSNDGSTDYPIPTSTSDLAEGTNLYFTTARARGSVSGSGNIFYDSSTGVISEALTTTDITEGDNLYFTAARARGNISVTDSGGDGSLAYDSGTGVITYTGPSAAETRAHISVTDAGGLGSATYDSGTGVITYTGPADSDVRGLVSVTDSGGLGSLAYDSGTGVITYTGPAELAAGKINLGSTSGTTIPVTPQDNFVTTANAFNLSNALTGVKSITSESSGDLDLIVDNSTGYVSLNREIDSVDTAGLEVDAQGFALKGLTPFNGFSASGTAPANVTGMVCTAVGPGSVTFTAGSNVVQITGIYPEAVFNGGSGTRDLADYYGNGMVFANFGITDSGNGNANRPITYPLSESHKTISLANSTAGGTANVIVDEVSPIDYVWTGNNLWDRGLWHTVENSTSNRRLIVGGALSASFTTVTNAIPVDRNDYYVNDTGTNSTTEFDTSSVTGMTGANVTLSGFSTAFYSSAQRRYKKTSLRSTKGSTNFSNVVLIGNDAQYDDSGFGYNHWPTFGMTTLWNGIDTPGNDTGAAQSPPITPGLKFIQFTDQTIQGSGSSNTEEASTGGPRILLNSSNGNISLNVAEYYPRQHQGLGVFGVYGSSKLNPFPRTRSMLPGGMYFTASEDWTANTGTDAYFVSTPKLTVGTDTDANAAKMFMASNNGETSLMGTSKVSFYTSGNAYAAGNIVGGYDAIKTTTEWANISSTGIQTAGTIAGATTTLKKFNETVVALGNQSGDISASLNATNGSIYTVTATGDITINTIANAVAGTSMRIIITQDGTGSRLLTSSMKFEGGSKTLTTAGGSIDIIDVFYDGTNYFAVLSKAYA